VIRLAAAVAGRHLLARKRQSIVSLLGIVLGVAFFLSISAMMQGSENDFIKRLVDNSPHITIQDEFRNPSVQPAESFYTGAAVEVSRVKPQTETRGIRRMGEIEPFPLGRYAQRVHERLQAKIPDQHTQQHAGNEPTQPTIVGYASPYEHIGERERQNAARHADECLDSEKARSNIAGHRTLEHCKERGRDDIADRQRAAHPNQEKHPKHAMRSGRHGKHSPTD